ncbi:MAG: response regulator [Candidatus Curtissbacteria bacterium]|nr:response regulator [Candidatus Curtissbacteria bacterium]
MKSTLDKASETLKQQLKRKRVKLPLKEAHQPPLLKGITMASKPKKILVIDDDSAILEATRIILEDKGYVISTLNSGELIHKVIKKEKPNLIIIDVWLPGEDGDKITQKLKSKDGTKKIPVVLMSANQDVKKIAKENKAEGFLSKPFEIDDLLSLVEKHLK